MDHDMKVPDTHDRDATTEKSARLLLEFAQSYPSAYLPSLRHLSRQFHLSYPAIRAAVHLLAKSGVLIVDARKRTRIAGRELPDLKPAEFPTFEKLYSRLKNDILDGSMVSGSTLPKVSYYTARDQISARTVSRAFRMLITANLIHKSGKSFVVGPAPAAVHSVRFRSKPSIIILTKRTNAWTSLCHEQRTRQFCDSFIREAEYCGIRLYEAHTGVPGKAHRSDSTKRISKQIKELGDNYRGTLIEGNRSEIPDIEHWARLILPFKQPVVWFDKNNEGFADSHRCHPALFRCHYSEERLADCALRSLMDAGHHSAVYLYETGSDWQRKRALVLENCAKSLKPDFVVKTGCFPGQREWDNPVAAGIFTQYQDLQALAIPLVSKAIRNIATQQDDIRRLLGEFYLRERTRSTFDECVALARARQRGVTFGNSFWSKWISTVWSALTLLPFFRNESAALIAPNDEHGRWHHLNWLADLELKVPCDVSVISFDNFFRDSFYPLTSVDPGFGGLGHKAFHALMQFSNVQCDRSGNISALPKVIDRGSVAQPNLEHVHALRNHRTTAP